MGEWRGTFTHINYMKVNSCTLRLFLSLGKEGRFLLNMRRVDTRRSLVTV